MYTVTLQAADGRTVTLTVTATSDERACSAAIRRANREHGRRGWLALPNPVRR